MIQEIPLRSIPNQSLQTRINGDTYDITIESMRDRLYITVFVNDLPLVRNRALLSFAPFEGGLQLVDLRGRDDPAFQELGTRFKLMYWGEA